MVEPLSVSELSAGARLTVDLAAIQANYRLISGRVQPARTAAVVKADAYGLGARAVAPALYAAGCRVFFVAHLAEAQDLRPILPADAQLYVLNGLQPGAEAACAAEDIRPVLNSPEQIQRWLAAAEVVGRRLPAAIQVDSGMARLGLAPDDVAALAANPEVFERLDVDLVMSHLACADTPDALSNPRQVAAFAALADRLPPRPRSLANSAGSFAAWADHGDLVRPGLALYGGAPIDGLPNPMQAVVTLEARAIQIRTVRAGDGVGYGLTSVADHPRRIATISIGYADGWPRSLGGRGAAWFRGQRLPIAGRVSMDSITLDVTALAEGALQPGDAVELIGPHQSLDQVAHDADTIAYEVLTRLGRRFARTYVGGAASVAPETGG